MGSLALVGLAAAVGLMTAAWALSIARRNAGVVDQAWGLTLVLLAWVYVLAGHEVTERSLLAAGLVTVWGLRLSGYLWWRERGKGEDWRYREMRAACRGSFAARSLVTVFWFQAAAAVGLSLPLLAAVRSGQPDSLGWLDVAGVCLWTAGFLVETIADWQLARFRSGLARASAPPAGGPTDSGGPSPTERARGMLDTGLWRYSRHPNYFGEAVLWWGLGVIGLAADAWWALLGPAGMTYVLLRVTGVAAMERHMAGTRGEAHRDYVSRTSPFLPLPPRPADSRSPAEGEPGPVA